MTAGTADASPIKERLNLTAGLLTTAEIKFPAGCHGLVKVRLFLQGSQIVPLSSEEYVIGDDMIVKALINKELAAANASLEFQGSSPSATYNHTITVSCEIVSTAPTTQQAIEINADEDIIELLYRICIALDVHDGFVPRSKITLPKLVERPYEPTLPTLPPTTPPTDGSSLVQEPVGLVGDDPHKWFVANWVQAGLSEVQYFTLMLNIMRALYPNLTGITNAELLQCTNSVWSIGFYNLTTPAEIEELSKMVQAEIVRRQIPQKGW